MAYGYGRCTNFDYCSIADARKDVAAPMGEGFVCPECRKPLRVPAGVGRSGLMVTAALGVVLIAAAGAGAYFLFGGHGAAPSNAATPERVAETAPAPTQAPQIPAAQAAVAPAPAAPAKTAMIEKPVAAPVPAATPVPPAQAGTVVLRLSGSNTVGAVLGPKLAQSFLAESGDSNVSITPSGTPDEVKIVGQRGDKTEIITVAAHGSATAFTDLGNNTTDIGMASRRVKPTEATSLSALGDMNSPANEHVLALDGIAVVVSPDNPVSALTLDQLRGIFSGKLTDWSQLGQRAGAIHVYARDDKSGTFDTFKSLVLGSVKLVATAQRIEDSRELSNDVTQDRNGIGFIGLPYILSARAVPVSETGAAPLLPNRLTVGTEDYALSRRLFLYTAANSTNPLVRRFTDYALSASGQAIVEQAGFIPLTITQAAAPVPGTASAKYRSLVAQATRLSTNFRFLPNSTALDNRGERDLDRLVNYVVSVHAQPSQIILVGFADNQGNASSNMAVSRKRAEAVAAGLAQRGLKITHVAAFGSDLPVADNSTNDGREKNRRVEVYIKL